MSFFVSTFTLYIQLERANTFLYEEEQIDEDDLSSDIERVASETGLETADVINVVNSLLGIMEERREERGIKAGEAHPIYILRRGFRRHWGGA